MPQKTQLNRIKLINLRLDTEEEDIIADLIIDGKLIEGSTYISLAGFLADSHLNDFGYIDGMIKKEHYSLPKLNELSRYNWTLPEVDLRLTKEEISKLPKTQKFKSKAKRKLIAIKKKNLKLNIAFQSDRELRNHHFQNKKKYSHFYFDTCSCGSPGCVGIWNGLLIKKTVKNGENVFIYQVANKKDGYENSGILRTKKQILVFPEADIFKIRKQISPYFQRLLNYSRYD